jgi:hypothetical protein
MTGDTFWWIALGLFAVGALRTELRRINAPDEPFFPRSFGKWKHARVGAPWVAAAVLLFLVGAIMRLVD